MIKIAKTMVLVMLTLAVISGLAAAQQANVGAAGASPGTGGAQTFTVGGQAFSINTINQVDATRLQEMGVQTVSVPSGKTVYVTYFPSGQLAPMGTIQGAKNTVVFGPNGYLGAMTWTGGLTSNAPQPYSFTGTAGQYYVIAQRTDGGIRDMMLVSFD